MAIPGRLTLEALASDGVIVREAAVDAANGNVLLRDAPSATLPPGGILRITQLVDRAYGEAEDAAVIAQIAEAFFGLTDGRIEVAVIDESIPTSENAQARADSEIAIQATGDLKVKFFSNEEGWAPGQRLPFVWSSQSIDYTLFVNTVEIASRGGVDLRYGISCGLREDLAAGILAGRVAGSTANPRRPVPVRVVEFS